MAIAPNTPRGSASSQARIDALAEKARRDADQAQAPSAAGAEQGEASSETTQQTEQQPEEAEDQSLGPVGAGEREVREGECISSIAHDTGHFWETIWNDPDNAELQELRPDPNVLLPGDRIHIPEIRSKQEPGETEMRHRFVRRGEPTMFRLRVLEGGEPRANQSFVAEIDGNEYSGVTDAEGRLQFPVPANAREGALRVGSDDDMREYPLRFRHLDPLTELGGVQQRLNNLGFDCGPADGEMNDRTERAITTFQAKHELEQTGQADEATRERLRTEYGR